MSRPGRRAVVCEEWVEDRRSPPRRRPRWCRPPGACSSAATAARSRWRWCTVRHQDWSFPKGKLEAVETYDAAASREVYEETGLVCRLLRFIGHAEYIDRKGRPKVVAYWVMAAESGSSHRTTRSTIALAGPLRCPSDLLCNGTTNCWPCWPPPTWWIPSSDAPHKPPENFGFPFIPR